MVFSSFLDEEANGPGRGPAALDRGSIWIK
jgi:hypothetical protein